MNSTNMEPAVPTSKPLPKKEILPDEEKKAAIKNITETTKAKNKILSFGIVNLPSTSLAISQKNKDIVEPIAIKKPLPATKSMGVYGMKKNIDKNIVKNNAPNDNLLKRLTLFDSIIFF